MKVKIKYYYSDEIIEINTGYAFEETFHHRVMPVISARRSRQIIKHFCGRLYNDIPVIVYHENGVDVHQSICKDGTIIV